MINILIADDNEEIAMQTSQLLMMHKDIKVVDIAKNGKEALDFYFALHPDILIVDIDMPVINGVEVINYLCDYSKEEKSKCNIIVVSGHIRDIPLNSAAKVFRIIEKPFDINLLIKNIYDMYEFLNDSKKESQIEGILSKLQFDFSHIGTLYLSEALITAYKSGIYTIDTLYEKLAQKHNVSEKQVRWNIENAINYTHKHFGIKIFMNTFENYDGRKPTVSANIKM